VKSSRDSPSTHSYAIEAGAAAGDASAGHKKRLHARRFLSGDRIARLVASPAIPLERAFGPARSGDVPQRSTVGKVQSLA